MFHPCKQCIRTFSGTQVSIHLCAQDDIIDGPNSFLDAAEHLKRCGASKVYIIATHGILSGNAVQEIEDSEAVEEVS